VRRSQKRFRSFGNATADTGILWVELSYGFGPSYVAEFSPSADRVFFFVNFSTREQKAKAADWEHFFALRLRFKSLGKIAIAHFLRQQIHSQSFIEYLRRRNHGL
jgi:hypothetical protein